MFRSPKFWQHSGFLSNFFKPFSWLYQKVSTWQESRIITQKVKVPVICVGNLVMGGAGKTPTVIAITKILQKMGLNPHVLSRGYGGYFRNGELVSRERHSYLQVGDEPLLLSKTVPTWIGANRLKTANLAIKHGATVLVMDDGLQNPNLYKDLSFMVIDSIQGFGNKNVFPAGPLREPIQKGLNRSHAIIIIGHNDNFSLPLGIHQKTFQANLKSSTSLECEKVVGFAGIGFPEKFKKTLLSLDLNLCEFITFADHHPYTITEIESLRKKTLNYQAKLVTTAKDFLRIPPHIRSGIHVVDIELEFENLALIQKLITEKISNF